MRILLADDEADIRLLVRTRLETSGRFEVVAEAADGFQALEMIERHRPDGLVIDLNMPNMNGLEAIPQIRAGAPSLRVVVFSAYAPSVVKAAALSLGADAVLEKTADIGELESLLLGDTHVPQAS